ncbi:Uncharacterised protein [Vibrio cholerae]|nr:Uncharacterised protein [Vibrio cholerae]
MMGLRFSLANSLSPFGLNGVPQETTLPSPEWAIRRCCLSIT